MSNQTAQSTNKVSFSSFQHKLDAFKTKVELQQALAQSLLAETLTDSWPGFQKA